MELICFGLDLVSDVGLDSLEFEHGKICLIITIHNTFIEIEIIEYRLLIPFLPKTASFNMKKNNIFLVSEKTLFAPVLVQILVLVLSGMGLGLALVLTEAVLTATLLCNQFGAQQCVKLNLPGSHSTHNVPHYTSGITIAA